MATDLTTSRPTEDALTSVDGHTMMAIVQHEYGAPRSVLQLQEVATPAVGDNEVLVRVRAASVNPADWHFIRGTPSVIRLTGYGLRRPKNPIPGIDVAGVITIVGKDVTGRKPGDEVFGWCQGAYAEQVSAPQDHFALKPPNITFEQAAAVPVAGFTALQGLRDQANLKSGQAVLIIGASGGVGTFAVQIAKALGAEVTGVCSTRNMEMVMSLGADHVIDYTKEDFAVGDRRYDVIFQLAGTLAPSKCRRVLTREGTLLLCSGDGRMTGMGRIAAAMVTSPFVSQKQANWIAKPNNADLMTLVGLIESGKVKPQVDKTYALADTPAAVAYVETGHSQGKVIIAI